MKMANLQIIEIFVIAQTGHRRPHSSEFERFLNLEQLKFKFKTVIT